MNLFAMADPRPIHFMGIAGAGMSGLALLARQQGVTITGCDTDPSGAADLAALGVEIWRGHGPEHVPGARALVVTAAVAGDHPELERARALGVPVVRRADALGQAVAGGLVVAVVNNVEADHLECYGGSIAALERAFAEFAGRARRVIVGADDAGALRIAAAVRVPVWRVGLAADADVRIAAPALGERGSAAQVALPDGRVVRVALQVPGLHNLRNAAAAVAVALELGVDLERCITALERFTGVARRFERVGEARGVTVVDDYAHHPTEVLATLAAARQAFPRRRVVAVFQPHLFSRTALHGEALGRALASADVVVVAPIYGAREQPLPGVTAELVVRGAERAGAATVAVRDRAALVDLVAERVRPGDVVFTLGAGDVTRVGPELLQYLGRGEAGEPGREKAR